MPNNLGRKESYFEKYEAMSDQILEEYLRQDANGEEAAIELDELLCIMEVLAQRKRNAGMIVKTPEEAWESLEKDYLYTDEEVTMEQIRPKSLPTKTASKWKTVFLEWRRAFVAVAASLAIVICCSFSAKSMGFDLWDFIATWSKETFSLSDENATKLPEPATVSGYTVETLEELFDLYGIDLTLIPSWLPNDYALLDVIFDESLFQVDALIVYKRDDDIIKISIKSYIENEREHIETSNEGTAYYEYNGISLYIFENMDQLQGVWSQENYQCYISGDLTQDELISVFKSMQKG